MRDLLRIGQSQVKQGGIMSKVHMKGGKESE